MKCLSHSSIRTRRWRGFLLVFWSYQLKTVDDQIPKWLNGWVELEVDGTSSGGP
jgi:hypothetical protein